ncbi:Hsp70 family protein [Dactylosporangium sp. CA-092794]|uniref:Hsp70 family protein n=1 Tax=Dactylosporangium sp. CA-092794 TaxID=3239929 RepID=UPI003D91B348
MTQPQQGFAIGVDLGTSNTVAVIRHPDGRTRPLLVDGAPIMPSGVYVDEAGRLHVGRDAYRMAGLDPSRFEPNPKRRIDEPAVLLGDREIPTVDLLAAILAAVARSAVEAVGFLPAAVLTYPAAWGSRRRETLAAAAHRAGWPPVTLVPEPVAAARYFADVLRRPVPVGAAIAVFDFGGGTLDIAVVRNDGGRFSVVGSGGIEDLGGLDVDAAVIEHLGAVIAATSPAAWAALQQPQTTTQRRDRRLFWDDVRGAKEMLSRATVAPITVPGRDQAIHLTREELERVTEPLIRRAVWETGKVVHSAGLRPDQLAGLFLVGGSSRLPLAARLLHAELGIAPTVLEQPELPVAEGAIAEFAPAGYQTEAVPVSSAFVPSVPAPAAPSSAPPASPGPAYAAPGLSAPVSPGFSGSPVAVPPGRRRGPGLLVGVIAAIVVLALVAAGGYWFLFRDRINAVPFKTFAVDGSLDLAAANAITYPVTATRGSRVYAGWMADKKFHFAAYDLDDKKQIWTKDVDGDNYRWQLYPNPGGLIAIGSGGTKGAVKLYDPDNGALLKTLDFGSDDRVNFFADVWVLHSTAAKKTTAYAWNGAERWSIPDDQQRGTKVVGSITTADGRGPSDLSGNPSNRDVKSRSSLVTLDSGKINLRDVGKKGTITRTWNDTSDSYATYVVFDNLLFVYSTSANYTVKVYDLTKQSEPEQIFTTPDDKRRIADLQPCGTGRICILDGSSSDGTDTVVRAVSIADKQQVWEEAAPKTDTLVPVGKQILATAYSSGGFSRLFGNDGKQLLKSEDQAATGVRVTNGSLLFFTKPPSSYDGDVSLVGVTASSGDRVALGTLSKVTGTSCSWNASRIACVGAGKLQVWSFA